VYTRGETFVNSSLEGFVKMSVYGYRVESSRLH